MSGIKSRRPMAVHTSPSLEDGQIFQSLQLFSGLGVEVIRSSSPSHWISTYFQTSSRQESTQTTSHMFHQQYRGTWRISQSLRPKSIKAKFAVLVIAPRCFVGVTSVRRVTEAGPPIPMATPKHILSSAQRSGPWRTRNSWKGPKLDLTHDKVSPSKVLFGCIMMCDTFRCITVHWCTTYSHILTISTSDDRGLPNCTLKGS